MPPSRRSSRRGIGTSANVELLYAFLSAAVRDKGWGARIELRAREGKFREYFPGSVWLEEGYAFVDTPAGEVRAGKVGSVIGVADQTFGGDLFSLNGVNRNPDWGVQIVGSRPFGWDTLEWAARWAERNDRVAWEEEGKGVESDPSASLHDGLSARVSYLYNKGLWTLRPGLSGGTAQIVPVDGRSEYRRNDASADVTASLGPLSLAFEGLLRSADEPRGGEYRPTAERDGRAWLGTFRLEFPTVVFRYTYSEWRYTSADSNERIHQPAVVWIGRRGIEATIEYVARRAPDRGIRPDLQRVPSRAGRPVPVPGIFQRQPGTGKAESMKKALAGGVIVVAVVAGGVLLLAKEEKNGPRFRKEKVTRGSVVSTVTATGTLSAVTTVKVGSQVSGIISKLYVDFNSEVKKGQLLAELDPAPFQSAVDQRRADLEKSKVELRNADLVLARAKKLLEAQLQAQSDFDTAKANRDGAAAAVEQSMAALRQAETNLAYTRIASPIDGVVVDRQYDIGQTVAASFQAPTLFTIAQDLTKMQVLTNIDEADIGRVKEGQEATFTVDAFADRTFHGKVSQIRLSPQTVQNVVTYPVLLDVSNPELKLRPGMTANVLVPVDRRDDVLRVPNAALRFRPDPADLEKGGKKDAAKAGPKAPEEKAADAVGVPSGEAAGGARGERAGRGNGAGRPGSGSSSRPGGGRPGPSRDADLYVELPTGKLRAIHVKTALTDGNVTAVESDALKEGDEVVVGLATARAMGTSGGGPRGMGRM